MRDKIWYEMVHSNFGEIYLAYYLNKQKSNIKFFKILTLIFSTSGIFSWAIWQHGFLTMISCIIVSIIQLLNLVENQIILNDKDIEKVSHLREKYVDYFFEIEKFWNQYNLNEMSENDCNEKFFEIREKYKEIESLDNKLQINSKKKKLLALTETDTKDYFKQYHS